MLRLLPNQNKKVRENVWVTFFLFFACVSPIYWLNKMEDESPGNVARRRAASGKLPFLMFCDKEILYHGFLCFASIMVTVTQATVLNFFIIAFFRGYYHQVKIPLILTDFFIVEKKLRSCQLGWSLFYIIWRTGLHAIPWLWVPIRRYPTKFGVSRCPQSLQVNV